MFLFVFEECFSTQSLCFLLTCSAFKSSGSDQTDRLVRLRLHHPLLNSLLDDVCFVFHWITPRTLYLLVSLPHFNMIPYLLRRFVIHIAPHRLHPLQLANLPNHLNSITPLFHQNQLTPSLRIATLPLLNFTIILLPSIILKALTPVAITHLTKQFLDWDWQSSSPFLVKTVSNCCWQPCKFARRSVDLSFFGWKVSRWGGAGRWEKAKDWEVPAFYGGAQVQANTALLNP